MAAFAQHGSLAKGAVCMPVRRRVEGGFFFFKKKASTWLLLCLLVSPPPPLPYPVLLPLPSSLLSCT